MKEKIKKDGGGGGAQWLEHSLHMLAVLLQSEALGRPGVAANACHLGAWKARQEDQKFTVILGCIERKKKQTALSTELKKTKDWAW